MRGAPECRRHGTGALPPRTNACGSFGPDPTKRWRGPGPAASGTAPWPGPENGAPAPPAPLQPGPGSGYCRWWCRPQPPPAAQRLWCRGPWPCPALARRGPLRTPSRRSGGRQTLPPAMPFAPLPRVMPGLAGQKARAREKRKTLAWPPPSRGAVAQGRAPRSA